MKYDDLLPPVTPEDVRLMDDELTRLRQLARRGDVLAAAAGPVLAWWGLMMGIMSYWHVALLGNLLPSWLPDTLGPLPTIFGCVGSFAIDRWLNPQPLLKSWRSHAISMAWGFAGLVFLVIGVGAALSGEANATYNIVFSAMIFSLVTAVMGASSARTWLLWPAAGWMIVGFLSFFIREDLWRAGLFGLASTLFMLVPGLMIYRYREV
ncbi:hypothetical protein [Asticcacaulis sp. YBE204]|uniref:hypothetical protein n=1 Tax=Asticcacaulis sp. YBE204 TaxID=1282363 RepID=UPI0003C40104|nr:hypothetical protein [Asticcacaulis sp. YBE204]ESQ78374.1 hypothetical protein AEYBE204_14475 [Asticcacaulis sp. YBE204]